MYIINNLIHTISFLHFHFLFVIILLVDGIDSSLGTEEKFQNDVRTRVEGKITSILKAAGYKYITIHKATANDRLQCPYGAFLNKKNHPGKKALQTEKGVTWFMNIFDTYNDYRRRRVESSPIRGNNNINEG